jgi:pyridoxal phosphate enzyme (YggS family)
MTNDLPQRYQQVKQHITSVATRLHKPEPMLLAVSKKHPAEAIRTLYTLGQRQFGESYWQEAEQKMQQLADLDIEWHFIGPIQSNKTRPIAEHFHWVHSVERLKIAQRLSEQRSPHLPKLNVCLQVNIDNEDSKSGAAPQQVVELAQAVSRLPNLCLKGLMCIPSATEDGTRQRAAFHQLAQLQRELARCGIAVSDLSMGMSSDLEAAISEGSSIVRVGTGLFGDRQKNVTKAS